MKYLSAEFLSKYDDVQPPFGGNGLGEFVYLRTYARWLPEKNRRENWKETVARVVEYSMSLHQGKSVDTLQTEAELLFDHMFNLKVFPAGRTLWIGGTEAAKYHPSANFNCAFIVMDSFDAFGELFHLLLVGSGVGFRILEQDVSKMGELVGSIVLAHKPYNGKAQQDRREDTVVFEESDNDKASVHIVVGDSKKGWVTALLEYFKAMQRKDVESIIINYDSVRPSGELLKVFGGRASGHLALKRLFRNIHKVIRRGAKDETYKLTTLDVLDINNFIGNSVVVGGEVLLPPTKINVLNSVDVSLR